jgi:hypothetical protein
MTNQKTATYNAITKVLADNGISFEDGMNAAEVMTKEMKSSVYQILIGGFNGGEIELDASFDRAKLGPYVSGLVSNWLRKDKRLNGNVVFAHKKPGSRVGSGDAQVKTLRELKKITTEASDIQKIEEAISKRLGEIKPAKKVEIDVSLLPENLRHLIG